MGNLTEHNSYMDVQDEDGNTERHFPITKLHNVLGLDDYTDKEIEIIKLLILNSYVLDDTNGQLYKIGSSDGKFYFEPAEKDLRQLVSELESLI